MNAPLALHTAARRWLMDRHLHWTERYAEIGGPGRTPRYNAQDLDTFPRYNVATAMLEGVERLRPEELPALEEARERIAAAAREAQTPFTRPPHGEIEKRAMDEERTLFAAFVRGVGEAELAAVEPYPYRRVLSGEEVRAVDGLLRERWGVDAYWYPLAETARADMVALVAHAFHRGPGADGLREILARRGNERVWEIREHGASYEIDLALMDADYTGAEGFWCTPEMDWLVYASHESSVTVGGAWLVDAVKAAWPEWERHLWSWPPY